MNREVHVRIWERPEVRILRANRHQERFPPPNLRGCYGFREGTFAGTRANGRDAPKPDLYAAARKGELRTLRVIRQRRRDQQGSTRILTGRSASETDAFSRKS
jgi:hypothetical protein